MYNAEYTLCARTGLAAVRHARLPDINAMLSHALPTSLYLHIPFCARKCPYCDFTSYADADHLIARYVRALTRQIASFPVSGIHAQTVFVGGGTPTRLTPADLGTIVAALRDRFRLSADVEMSIETNPGSSDARALAELRQIGFNRVSIGVQSLNDATLASFGRSHSAGEAVEAIAVARSAGFRNVSADLIYGAPGQSCGDWSDDLEHLAGLGVDHISTYGLTIEPGTPYATRRAAGTLSLPPEDHVAWMYERAIARLQDLGYEHYEISNFARPGFQCRHNLTYWRNEPYVGFGAGAASYLDGVRSVAERDIVRYATAVEGGLNPVGEAETLGPRRAAGETVMLGLRLRTGLRVGDLERRFGREVIAWLAERVETSRRRGHVSTDDGVIRLTHAGLMVADDVLADLLPDD